ncbi:heterokaryon incompatibility protein-domain-containing protein [Podospora didyma]|uniref:Heterokaryon incompatibility protein-domain-containing protein n=1 Tax=Podospora didyma TaxID=330526 RepID=A0AAE0U4G0_9PEZI|nr:heterokaryon incompatibility protein-domain-containing protein [Podospora didyma]
MRPVRSGLWLSHRHSRKLTDDLRGIFARARTSILLHKVATSPPHSTDNMDHNSIETITTRLQHALALVEAHILPGGFAAAETVFQLAREEWQATLDPEHEAIFDIAYLQGFFYERNDHASRAEEVWRALLDECDRLGGRFSKRSIKIATQLGHFFAKRDRVTEYEDMYRRVVQAHKKLRTRSKEAFLDMARLADALQRQQRYGEAEDLWHEAIQGCQGLVGMDNGTMVCDFTNALVWIVFAHFRQLLSGNTPRDSHARLQCVTKAARLVRDLRDSQPSLGRAHTMQMLNMLGKMCLALGDEKNACVVFRFTRLQTILFDHADSPIFPICDVCEKLIHAKPCYVCKTCPDIDVCWDCYHAPCNQRSRTFRGLAECESHSFLEVAHQDTGAFDSPTAENLQEAALDCWLSNFIRLKQSDEDNFLDEFIPEPKVAWKVIRPAAQELECFEESMLQGSREEPVRDPRSLLWRRIFEIQIALPATTQQLFANEGFTLRSLPERQLSGRSTLDQIYEGVADVAGAFIRLAVRHQPHHSSPSDLSAHLGRSDTDSAQQNPIYLKKPLSLTKPMIRLLEILPGTSPQIRTSLFCIDFSQDRAYEALSYVWGLQALSSPAATTLVDVDGISVGVTPNLYSALLTLRHNNTSRLLWVDAICINQADNAEKATQVSMMSDIFMRADRVLVFLGDARPGSDLLFRYFNRDTRQDITLADWANRLETTSESLLREFVDFCDRGWWSRVWIQQEYAVAPQDPIFYLGRHSAEGAKIFSNVKALFDEFLNPEYFASHRAPLSATTNSQSPEDVMSSFTNRVMQVMEVLSRRGIESGRIHTREQASYLLQVDGALCTDPRDIVYGRLSFLEPTMRHIFVPDYSLPVIVVFEKLAAWTLIFDAWLDMFWYYPRKMPSCPSWVPDFTSRQRWLIGDSRPQPRTDMKGENGAITAWPAIYDRILAIHARPIDTVREVFVIDEPEWLSRASNLWHLDSYFATLADKTPSGSFSIRKALPRTFLDSGILQWASFMAQQDDDFGYRWTISASLESFPLMEYKVIIQNVFRPACSELFQMMQALRSETGAGTRSREEVFREAKLESEAAAAPEYMETYDRAVAYTVLAGVYCRLVWLQLKLDDLPWLTCGDLMGGSLFDLQNLRHRLRQVRIPQLGHDPGGSGSGLTMAESNIRSLLETLTTTKPINSDGARAKYPPVQSISDLHRPLYDDLQLVITDCRYQQEVLLRVELILQAAHAIHERLTPGNTTPRGQTTYLPAGETINLRDGQVKQLEEMYEAVAVMGDIGDVQNACFELWTKLTEGEIPQHAENEIRNERGKLVADTQTFSGLAHLYRQRTFFVTNNSFVGVGAPGVMDITVGDMVIMPENSNMPLLARPGGDCHELVGFASVRGLCDGRFHKLKEYQKPERKIFRFR